MGLLTSKVIIVTGGSLGIGFEVAKRCAEEGAELIIVARNKPNLLSAAKKLRKISNRNHVFYQLDVSNLSGVKKFSHWCNKNYSAISGLVNCAGIYGPIGKITQINLQKFNEAIQINFFGTVYMCHFFAKILESEHKKKIVNYSGGGAASPFANYSAYASSKAAIVRFTENISLELANENFDVNCIAPGFVITRLHQQTLEAGEKLSGRAFFENTKKQMENGGVPPGKAADLTAFLLSKASDGITGKFISAAWDNWQEQAFRELLRNDKDFATLRRIDNKTFIKKI